MYISESAHRLSNKNDVCEKKDGHIIFSQKKITLIEYIYYIYKHTVIKLSLVNNHNISLVITSYW